MVHVLGIRTLGHWILLLLLFGAIAGCNGQAAPTPNLVSVTINDLSASAQVDVESGTNVQSAILQAGLTLAALDRTEPPTFTLITAPLEITIFRVSEEFEIEEKEIPYEHQTVRNESLPEGTSLLIQPGENGLQQITYRRLLENGNELARTVFKNEVHTAPIPEIIMVGVQVPFSSLPIPGRLAYLNGGNAWLIETTTSNRVPVVTTGDLDGRIFSLSLDRSWLLFTRSVQDESSPDINSLWAANLSSDPPALYDLQVRNVIHYADWAPNAAQTIQYSTVEPREAPPGWQANNNLWQLVVGSDGIVLSNDEIIGSNSGGIYGWWGPSFAWSPDGSMMAYSRPDSVGLVNFEDGSYTPLVEILPFQTRADWAWVPAIAWSSDSQQLSFVTHQTDPTLANPESSPLFDLTAVEPTSGSQTSLASRAGIFANPSFSPAALGDPAVLTYLEAIFPEQSGSSRYRLYTMRSDGSNRTRLFPAEGSGGLDPQTIVWAPFRQENQPRYLALIYHGNIWLIDVDTAKTQQITGDGLVSRFDWE